MAGDIASENADMSSTNRREIRRDRKFKGFRARLILAERVGP
jgi:hypothetical protein